jgi:flagellar hook-basal body complex protein FliE
MSEFQFSLLDRAYTGAIKNDSTRLNGTPETLQTEKPGNGKSFSETLQDMFQDVNQAQVTADKATQSFVAGDPIQLHEVMLAVEKADIALRTATAFRNKIVEAYQEIMRMPV